MKKLIIALSMVAGIQLASAAPVSTNATLTINGTINATCTANFSPSTITFTDLTTAQTENTALQVTCTQGASYSMTATSANGWQMMNGTNGVPYTISYTGTNAEIATTWSGNPNDKAAVPITNKNQTGDGQMQSYPLAVANSIAPLSYPTGLYTDTVTVSVTYS